MHSATYCTEGVCIEQWIYGMCHSIVSAIAYKQIHISVAVVLSYTANGKRNPILQEYRNGLCFRVIDRWIRCPWCPYLLQSPFLGTANPCSSTNIICQSSKRNNYTAELNNNTAELPHKIKPYSTVRWLFLGL